MLKSEARRTVGSMTLGIADFRMVCTTARGFSSLEDSEGAAEDIAVGSVLKARLVAAFKVGFKSEVTGFVTELTL